MAALKILLVIWNELVTVGYHHIIIKVPVDIIYRKHHTCMPLYCYVYLCAIDLIVSMWRLALQKYCEAFNRCIIVIDLSLIKVHEVSMVERQIDTISSCFDSAPGTVTI